MESTLERLKNESNAAVHYTAVQAQLTHGEAKGKAMRVYAAVPVLTANVWLSGVAVVFAPTHTDTNMSLLGGIMWPVVVMLLLLSLLLYEVCMFVCRCVCVDDVQCLWDKTYWCVHSHTTHTQTHKHTHTRAG
jgi:hypothetical protein